MDIASVYLQVIRNVVDGVRADFSTEQLDEKALRTLATLWEHKLLNSGALNSNFVDVIKTENAGAGLLDEGDVVTNECTEKGVKRKAGEMEGDTQKTEDVPKVDHTTGSAAGELARKATEKQTEKEKGETLSSDSDDEARGAPGTDTQSGNLVLAQFDKVSHTKNKWKCSLKGGVMTLNNKDVLFGKANGEFTW